MRGDFGKILQQAQKMQAGLEQAQREIAALEVTGQSGGGMVTVTMNGRHEVKRMRIDPTLSAEDRDMLEDLVAAAVNDAVRRVDEAVKEKMSGLTAGLPLPPGMLPF